MNSKQQLLHPCHLPRTLLRAGLQEHGMDLRLQFTFTYCKYRLAQTTDPLVFKLILNFAFTSPRWGLLCFFFLSLLSACCFSFRVSGCWESSNELMHWLSISQSLLVPTERETVPQRNASSSLCSTMTLSRF